MRTRFSTLTAVVLAGMIVPILLRAQITQEPAPVRAETGPSVPRLIRYSGVASDPSGKPLTGTVALTFSLYEKEDDNLALWHETQEVTADAHGRYNVLLGSTIPEGMPAEIFESGRARWVGVQIDNQPERPRTLLISVPYALKAGDAETLGGLPASAFARASGNVATPLERSGSAGSAASVTAGALGTASTTIGGTGTTNFVPLWTSSATLGNSILFQSQAAVGIGTTAPWAPLTIGGTQALGFNVLGGGLRLFDLDFNGLNNGNSSLSGALYRMDLRPGQPVHQWWTRAAGQAFPSTTEDAKMVILENGDVGIGTVSPSSKLALADSNQSFSTILSTQNTAPGGGAFSVVNFASAVGNAIAGDTMVANNAGSLLISPNSAGRDLKLIGGAWTNPVSMVVKDGGNVGIGTIAPTARLDVAGNVKIEGTGNGIVFPDGTTQSTAFGEGKPGPPGPPGPQGPPGPAGITSLQTVAQAYTNTTDLSCPSGYTAVFASCDSGVHVVLNDSQTVTNGNSWISYLTPNASAATGVQCNLGAGLSGVALLRCGK